MAHSVWVTVSVWVWSALPRRTKLASSDGPVAAHGVPRASDRSRGKTPVTPAAAAANVSMGTGVIVPDRRGSTAWWYSKKRASPVQSSSASPTGIVRASVVVVMYLLCIYLGSIASPFLVRRGSRLMTDVPATAPTATATERAYRHTRARVLDGTYPAGALITEGDVSEAVGVSR